MGRRCRLDESGLRDLITEMLPTGATVPMIARAAGCRNGTITAAIRRAGLEMPGERRIRIRRESVLQMRGEGRTVKGMAESLGVSSDTIVLDIAALGLTGQAPRRITPASEPAQLDRIERLLREGWTPAEIGEAAGVTARSITERLWRAGRGGLADRMRRERERARIAARRRMIAALDDGSLTQREIAKALGVHPSLIHLDFRQTGRKPPRAWADRIERRRVRRIADRRAEIRARRDERARRIGERRAKVARRYRRDDPLGVIAFNCGVSRGTVSKDLAHLGLAGRRPHPWFQYSPEYLRRWRRDMGLPDEQSPRDVWLQWLRDNPEPDITPQGDRSGRTGAHTH